MAWSSSGNPVCRCDVPAMSEPKIAGVSDRQSEDVEEVGDKGKANAFESAIKCPRGAVTMVPGDLLCESRKYLRILLCGVAIWLPFVADLVLYLLGVSIPPLWIVKAVRVVSGRGDSQDLFESTSSFSHC